MKKLDPLRVEFYKSDSGREPVREWLHSLSRSDKKTIGDDIKTVQFGWPVGMPLVRSIGGCISEVRSNLSDKRISRVLFVISDGMILLLHGFIKKIQKMPKRELDIAKERLRKST